MTSLRLISAALLLAAASPASAGGIAAQEATPAPFEAPTPLDLTAAVAVAKSRHDFDAVARAFRAGTVARIAGQPVHFRGIAATADGAVKQAVMIGLDSASAPSFAGYLISGDPDHPNQRAAGTLTGVRRGAACDMHAALLHNLVAIELHGSCTSSAWTGTFESHYGHTTYSGAYRFEPAPKP